MRSAECGVRSKGPFERRTEARRGAQPRSVFARRSAPGLSLIEVVLAAALLAIAAVPIITAILRATDLAREIELRTATTLLAQQEMETAMAAAAKDFSANVGRNSKDLGGGYLATIAQNVQGLTKTVTVQAGFDKNHDGFLSNTEVLVTLATIVADPGSTG